MNDTFSSFDSLRNNSNDYLTINTEQARNSIQKHLLMNDYEKCFDKIKNNIGTFKSEIEKLKEIYNDNNNNTKEIENLITNIGDGISETFYLLDDIKNFEYKSRNEKIQNIQRANDLEDQCNKYKDNFLNLSYRIKTHNNKILKRNTFSDFSIDVENMNSYKDPLVNVKFKTGKEFLDQNLQKHNNALDIANNKIELSISRTSFHSNNNSRNNSKKLSNDSIDININNNLHFRRDTGTFLKMEAEVKKALEGGNHSFFSKHWKFILFVLIVIIILLYIYRG